MVRHFCLSTSSSLSPNVPLFDTRTKGSTNILMKILIYQHTITLEKILKNLPCDLPHLIKLSSSVWTPFHGKERGSLGSEYTP
jgi:hypothetical protein